MVRDNNKTELVAFRLTASEHKRLTSAAASAAMTESAYLRSLIAGRTVQIVQLPIDGKRLDAVMLELKKSGTNLNQIARRLNRGDRVAPVEFVGAMNVHRNAVLQLAEFIDETRPSC